MFKKVLIANRGLVASRIIRTLKQLGIKSVVVYSEPDAKLPFVHETDEAYALQGTAPAQTYLNKERLLEVLRSSRADAVHPGYGFLAENADFARAVTAAGIKFIGPSAPNLELMGDKNLARQRMAMLGVPVLPATGCIDQSNNRKELIDDIGYPLIVKAAAGGGGIGMNLIEAPEHLSTTLERTSELAQRVFGDGSVYLERYIAEPRHIEFQIIADQYGNVRHLYERDCTMQRRHQKVIEEAPVSDPQSCLQVAETLCSALTESGYDNIGTVEMLRDTDGSHYFIEMNTRLQVEHAVTEAITGIDLVEIQLHLAAGERLDAVLPELPTREGHAMEVRIYAEDPDSFIPSPGYIDVLKFPQRPQIRCELSVRENVDVSRYYDPVLALVIANGESREESIGILSDYLSRVEIKGLKTNIPFIQRILRSPEFRNNIHHTGTGQTLVKNTTAPQLEVH